MQISYPNLRQRQNLAYRKSINILWRGKSKIEITSVNNIKVCLFTYLHAGFSLVLMNKYKDC